MYVLVECVYMYIMYAGITFLSIALSIDNSKNTLFLFLELISNNYNSSHVSCYLYYHIIAVHVNTSQKASI